MTAHASFQFQYITYLINAIKDLNFDDNLLNEPTKSSVLEAILNASEISKTPLREITLKCFLLYGRVEVKLIETEKLHVVVNFIY